MGNFSKLIEIRNCLDFKVFNFFLKDFDKGFFSFVFSIIHLKKGEKKKRFFGNEKKNEKKNSQKFFENLKNTKRILVENIEKKFLPSFIPKISHFLSFDRQKTCQNP